MTSKPWTRWWWLGSAVDETSITQQLEQFSQAGLGGVEICPIYGVKGYDAQEKAFLSAEWMKVLAHTTKEGKRLSIGVDMTTGTGWPFGGPWVKDQESLMSISWKDAATATMQNATTRNRLMMVKRAAPGGAGPVIDPFSLDALNAYLKPFDESWQRDPISGIRAQFHDSFEYYGANWTPEMPAQFQRLRGYDLTKHLPALAGHGERDIMARVKHDYRMTLSDLHVGFMRHWNAWSKQKQYLTRNQAHGAPANLIDLYAASDIPETEAFGGLVEDHIPMLQMASSAAHLKGSTLSSAESFTWLGEHFQTPLSDLKSAADYLWLCGVNHIFFHGIPYSPADASWPGWQFYASVNMGPTGGLWHSMPSFSAYIQRVQSVLQQGRSDADVLLYFPLSDIFQRPDEMLMPFTMHNVEQYFAPHPFYKKALEFRSRGVQFDFISDEFLGKATVRDGKLILGEQQWSALYMPEMQVIPLETMKKLLDLASKGATIVFAAAAPKQVEGFYRHQEREAELRSLLQSDAAKKFHIAPDAQSLSQFPMFRGESMRQQGLHFIRRQVEGLSCYLIVNRSDHAFRDYVTLRGKQFALLDPMAENRIGVPTHKDGETSRVLLELAAGASIIVKEVTPEQTASLREWTYQKSAAPAISLEGFWNIGFTQGGPLLPDAYRSKSLASWTEQADQSYRDFSGTARYSTTVTLNENHRHYLLDLGQVAESADVFINGKKVANLWARPFVTVVSDVLKQGENSLVIEVTNLAANRIAYMDRQKIPWKTFKEINIVNKEYKPFDASAWTPRPSGLLGPVTLTTLE